MLYTIRSEDWSAGRPLRPGTSPAVYFRTRAEAEEAAEGRATLAVAVRFDEARGVVVPEGPVARQRTRGWSAPAALDGTGAVAVLAPIPGVLVRSHVRAELRAHPATPDRLPRPHAAVASRAVLLAPAGVGRLLE